MVRFTKLAVAVALAMQPLFAVSESSIGTPEQQAALSQEQFEGLIESIPDENVRNQVGVLYQDMNYDELGGILIEYLDNFFDTSYVNEGSDVIERKKENVMRKINNFILQKVEDEDRVVSPAYEGIEELDLKPLIDSIPDEPTRAMAQGLFAEGKYDDLQLALESYLDANDGVSEEGKKALRETINSGIAEMMMGDVEKEDEIENDAAFAMAEPSASGLAMEFAGGNTMERNFFPEDMNDVAFGQEEKVPSSEPKNSDNRIDELIDSVLGKEEDNENDVAFAMEEKDNSLAMQFAGNMNEMERNFFPRASDDIAFGQEEMVSSGLRGAKSERQKMIDERIDELLEGVYRQVPEDNMAFGQEEVVLTKDEKIDELLGDLSSETKKLENLVANVIGGN